MMFAILVILVPLCLQVDCKEDIAPLFQRMDDFDSQMIHMKRDISQLEERIWVKFDVAKISLRVELKQFIKQNLRDAIANYLHGDSVEELIGSQVVSDVHLLKRENTDTKKQLQNVLRSLADVQKENLAYKEALRQSETTAQELRTCSKYVLDSEVLQTKLNQCNQEYTQRNVRIVELEEKLNALNDSLQEQHNELSITRAANNCSKYVAYTQTLQKKFEQSGLQLAERENEILELKQTLAVLNESRLEEIDGIGTIVNDTIEESDTTSLPPTTTTTKVTTLITTTSEPEGQRSRILVAPLWSLIPHQFRQVSILSNAVENVTNVTFKHVTSLVYVSSHEKLLICLFNPNKIISSSLDGEVVETVIDKVCAYDMTVDEEKETVFMTTCMPLYSISKMTTRGIGFKTITNVKDKHAKVLFSITVNPIEKKVYACSEDKLFIVSYAGNILQMLGLGNGACAITLDPSGDILYYNNLKNVMKMSLSQNVSSVVTTLDVIPWNLRYYEETVYFSSTGSATGVIGAVRLDTNVTDTLQTVTMKGSSTFFICLLP